MRLGIVLLSLAAATIGPALVAAAPTAGSSPALPNSEAGLDNPSCGARSLTALEEGGEGGAEEKFDDSEEKNKCRAAAVVEAFRHSWAGYKKYAWGADELLPVSNKPGNSRWVTGAPTPPCPQETNGQREPKATGGAQPSSMPSARQPSWSWRMWCTTAYATWPRWISPPRRLMTSSVCLRRPYCPQPSPWHGRSDSGWVIAL